VPQEYDLQVHMPDDPAMAAFKGGARFAESSLYQHLAWTKLIYEEHGSARLHGHGGSPPVASD
jgi:actin-related protein